VQVCPVEALKPADLFDGFGVGVPFIEPRKQACDFSCDVGAVHPRLPDRRADLPQARLPPRDRAMQLPSPPVLLARRTSPSHPEFHRAHGRGAARAPEACLSVRVKA
jgi:ferredoxin-type protein NapG